MGWNAFFDRSFDRKAGQYGQFRPIFRPNKSVRKIFDRKFGQIFGQNKILTDINRSQCPSKQVLTENNRSDFRSELFFDRKIRSQNSVKIFFDRFESVTISVKKF